MFLLEGYREHREALSLAQREVPGHGSSLGQRLLVLKKVVKGELRFLTALSQWVAPVWSWVIVGSGQVFGC